MEGQLAAARDAVRPDADLYFDLPLGVNPAGYDVWRHREAFALGASAGAPPDSFFPTGQDWGLPPLHPDRIREQGYAYPIACIRTLTRHAGVLRVDHVMALHRLFWVPRGLDPEHGVYVRYRPDEQYAILSLEAHRTGTVVVGEDLGTVPSFVRRAMDRRGIYRSYVLQEELRTDREAALRPPPPSALASLNTHDMPTFVGFWNGSDIDDQLELGLINDEEHTRAHERRALLRKRLGKLLNARSNTDVATVRDGLLHRLAESAARYVLVTLEDLWLEDRPQNVPGTSSERPNWQRRSRRTLDDIVDGDDVNRFLRDIDRRRRLAGKQSGCNND
jgi:4-alpha-glucanotransferase